MKINGFQVEEHGEGFAVTLRLHVGREELSDTFVSEPIRAVVQLMAGLPNMMEGVLSPSAEEPKAEAEAKPKVRTRKPRAKTEDAPDAKPEDAPAPTSRSSRRRRAGVSNAQPAKPDSPLTRRRRAGTKEAEKSELDPTSTASTAGRSSRKARASGAKPASEAKAKTTKSPSKKKDKKDEVSDEDLTKSASQAAALLGPPAVMDILDEFAVDEVRDLSQAQRKEFLAKLDDAKAAAA